MTGRQSDFVYCLPDCGACIAALCVFAAVAYIEQFFPTRVMVAFQSDAFNTSRPEKHFISRRAYGGDLATWLLNEIALRNADTEPMIGQKEFCWLVRFKLSGKAYEFLVGYNGSEWIGRLERRTGIIRFLFRRRQQPVDPAAVRLIDSVLSSSDLISDIRWDYAEEGA
jgi:hypothetical protein